VTAAANRKNICPSIGVPTGGGTPGGGGPGAANATLEETMAIMLKTLLGTILIGCKSK